MDTERRVEFLKQRARNLEISIRIATKQLTEIQVELLRLHTEKAQLDMQRTSCCGTITHGR